jgi:hypothetical protein
VDGIVTRAGHGIDDAARSPSELGRVGIGKHLELEYGLDPEQHSCDGPGRLVVDVVDVGAVEKEVVLFRAGPVNGNLWGAPS